MNKKQILPYEELYEAYLIASQERYKYKEVLDKIKETLKGIYMLDNVTITNNAVEKIDKALELLEEIDG